MNFGRNYVIVDSGVAAFRYGRKVEKFTIGFGTGFNDSRTNSCYECEEGNEFHFLLMLCLSDIYGAEEEWFGLTFGKVFFFFKVQKRKSLEAKTPIKIGCRTSVYIGVEPEVT